MATTKVWFDEQGDFLEVAFAEREGSFREIGPDMYERVDGEGRLLGFAILNLSTRDRETIQMPLDVRRVVAGLAAVQENDADNE